VELRPLFLNAMTGGQAHALFLTCAKDSAVTGNAEMVGDYVSLLRSFFGYETGDLDLLVVQDLTNSTYHKQIEICNTMTTGNASVNPQPYDQKIGRTPLFNTFGYPESGPVAFARIPRYNMTALQPVFMTTVNGAGAPNLYDTQQNIAITPWDGSSVDNFHWFRGAGPNYNLIYRRPPAPIRMCNG